ncbi:MAG: hypothetical protein WBB39_03630 [Candidatus Saccharimonadales bacterium]
MVLVVISVITIVLFSIAYITRRRFGVLGLSLAAGAVLAQYASGYVGDLLKAYDISIPGMSYNVFASVLLIMIPPLVLLAGGPTYHDKRAAVLGATGFAMLGLFFVLAPLSSVLPTDNPLVRDALIVMSRLQNFVIIAALVFALIDTFMIHGTIGRRYHKDKKR